MVGGNRQAKPQRTVTHFMNHFSPFKKSFNNLEAKDLAALRDITEGWYVEYKQEIPNAQSIAKSVSALANSYGGWVFYGIKEESKENSVAGEFIGIDSSEVDAALQRIRQAVAGLMNPACHFEARAIYGPCEEIGLKKTSAIICVTVPQSIEAPHVHIKGSIYRRIADGSEPVPETDRHMIEKMFQRSKATLDWYKRWIDTDPELSEAESDSSHLRILITPNPWMMPRPGFILDIDNVREALNVTNGRASYLPFDTIYPSASGIVARQCNGDDPTVSRITWNIEKDLTSDIVIPLNWFKGTIDEIHENIADYNFSDDFIDLLRQSNTQDAHVVNLNYIFLILMSVIGSQRALQRNAGWPLDFHIKIKLLNVWRSIPFLDIDYFIRHIEIHGIPVCLTENCTSPPGSHPDTFVLIEDQPHVLDERKLIAAQTLWAFMPIAEAYGFPLKHMIKKEHLSENNREPKELFYDKLTEAGIRSVKIMNSQTKT
jgi:hypothetical protein